MPKQKEDPNFYVTDERTGELKSVPKEPTMWDQVKEGFEAQGTRAQIDQRRKMYNKVRGK